jgi:hypothetical protein
MNKLLYLGAIFAVLMAVFWSAFLYILSLLTTPHFIAAIPIMLVSFLLSGFVSLKIATAYLERSPKVFEAIFIGILASIVCYYSFFYIPPYLTGSMLMTSEFFGLIHENTVGNPSLSRGVVFKIILGGMVIGFTLLFGLIQKFIPSK